MHRDDMNEQLDGLLVPDAMFEDFLKFAKSNGIELTSDEHLLFRKEIGEVMLERALRRELIILFLAEGQWTPVSARELGLDKKPLAPKPPRMPGKVYELKIGDILNGNGLGPKGPKKPKPH